MDALVFRVLSSGDRYTLVDFLQEVNSDFPISLDKKVNLSEYAEKLLEFGVVVACEKEGIVAGIVGGYVNDFKEYRAYISVVAVARRFRSEGIGGELLESFEEKAVFAGMKSAFLETHTSNSGAISLYRKHGYSLGDKLSNGNYRLYKILVGLSSLKPNLLLTSAGRRTYLVKWFKESLGNSGDVHVMNSNPLCPAFSATDKSVVSPLIYSSEYIPFVLEYCRENGIGAIIPLFDVDLPVLAGSSKAFAEAGVEVVAASIESLEVCSDKYKTYLTLKNLGMGMLPSYIDIEKCMEDVYAKVIDFPLIVKPRWGMGSIGVTIVEDECELRAAFSMVQRDIKSTYLKYESEKDLNHSVLIQVVADGQEYGMDVINDLHGNYRMTIVKKKIAMRAGETDAAQIIPADARFTELGRKLSKLIRQPGNLDVDVFEIEGELYILEMNARFGGGYPFSHAAGVNLPAALVTWLKGNECPEEYLEIKDDGIFLKDITIQKLPVL